MNDPFKDKKEDIDDDEDDDEKFDSDFDDFDDEWTSDSDDSDEEDVIEKLKARHLATRARLAKSARSARPARTARTARPSRSTRHSVPPIPPIPPVPSLPPMPPMPPLPEEFEVIKSDKVIGIRGLDKRLYKDISRIAKRNGVSVAELLNRLLAKYRFDSVSENGNTISNVKTLDLHEEELVTLADEKINLIDIKTLRFGPDITMETFSKINKIENINKIWVPSHLYLLLLKKVKHCSNIEKYKGDSLPLVMQKSFDSDVHLSRTFFDYFLETEEMVDLTVYGELRIDNDISLDDFKKVIYSLRVDSDIQAPRHLIGFLFAKAECYGEIEESDD